ncbi:MAG TPA: hypothetical protein VKN82_00585 [Desulfohalobiaceae bacterium]|nr:hypothetical protein [Desulfohalobiaceae bacterium]
MRIGKENMFLEIVKGDITAQNTEAIVNAAKSSRDSHRFTT